MRLPERHASADERLREVRGVEPFLRRGRAHRPGVEPHGLDGPDQRRQDQLERVGGVERRLLVLLEVAVVPERQAVQHRRQRREPGGDASGLRARELRGIGVPLLRHDARAGRVRLVELGPAQRGVGPPGEIGRQPRQVRRADRGVRQELLHEVPVRDGIDRVVERALEPESCGRRGRVEAERRRGQRPGAERRHRGPDRPLIEALEVAEQRPRVRQEMVPERDGLRGARVRRARHDGLGVLARASDERPREHRRQTVDAPARGQEPQAQVGDHEVVAAAAGVQPVLPRHPTGP